MPRKALGQCQHSCYPKTFQLATRKEGSERPQDIAGYQVLLDQRDAEIARQSAELSARDLLIEKNGDGQTNRPRSNRFENRTTTRFQGEAAFAAAGESCLYEMLANPIDGVAIGVPLSTIIGIELWFASGLHRLTRPDLSSHDVRPDVSGQEPHGIKARSSRQRWSDAFKKRTVAEASHLVTTIQLRTPDDSS